MPIIPTVKDRSPRGERYFDLFSKLLNDRVIMITEQVDDQIDGAAIPYRTLNAAGPHVTFAGNEFTVASAEGSVMLKGTFLLDATTIPRQFTWIDTIYSVSETGFILAFTRNGATKPTDFRTDVDQTMRRFVRRPEHFS